MADRPAAEVDITTALVRRLLGDQCPGLAHLDLEEVSEGWDNTVLRLGPDLAVRIPRRELSAQLVLNEQQWLPTLAAMIDVPVPAPVHRGRATDYFPWAWSVVPWFEGIEVGALPAAQRAPLAIDLARCVVALHRPAPPEAPVNPYRGVPLARRDADIDARLGDPSVFRADEARRAWADALAAPVWDGPALWLHGDLHPFNLLARLPQTSTGASVATASATPAPAAPQPSTHIVLCALLDFGDLTSGDPACDLATAWLTFDAAGRRTFRAEVDRLSGADEATWRRARGWALVLATAMLAHSDDDPRFAILGARALTEILDDEQGTLLSWP